MKNAFEDFLKEWHAQDYHGADDDMPEAFEAWLESLEQQTLIELADAAMSTAKLAGFKEARAIINESVSI